MTYKVYSGNTALETVANTYTTLTKLEQGKEYILSVTELDGADESDKSNIVKVKTLGQIILPTTKVVDSMTFATDTLGIESTGFGNDTKFGGTVPVNVPILSNTIVSGQRVLEVAADYHMSNQAAILVDTNKYLIIDKNRSIEIIVR